MTSGFAGKVAIVTGGGSGIGAAVSRRLAGDGAQVVIADIDSDAAREVSSAIRENGGEAHDVASEEPLRSAYYRQALYAWTLRLARSGPGGADSATMTCEQCENLRSLGYIQGDCKQYCQ